MSLKNYYKKQLGRLLVRVDHIRTQYISHRNFILFASLVVGALSAMAAVSLKLLVNFVEHQATRLNNLMHSNWLTALFPLIGVGISMLLLKRVFREKLSRGVGFIIHAVLAQRSKLHIRHTFGHILTSAVTVAMGGSVGLEAPIVATGSAIGSNTGHDFRLSKKDTTLLLCCGAASGIAAVFNSPIAGIIFTLEVMLLDFNIPFFIPLLISTATATVISQLLYPEKFFAFNIEPWLVGSIPFYVVMGIFCGLLSVYTTHIVEYIEKRFENLGLTRKAWLMGGIPLCLLTFLVPGLFGEGYSLVTNLLYGDTKQLVSHSLLEGIDNTQLAISLMCLFIIFLKPLSAALTVGAGGNGGVFAPSLIIGGIAGFLFAFSVNNTGYFHLRTENFIVTGMAGVLAGVMHAPLTAIFLLAEITGGYTLFIPLMIVTAISYFITRRYIRSSLYHKTLIENNIIPSERNESTDEV